MLGTVLHVLSWALIGFLAGGLGALALATIAIPIFDISQMEGAYAMGIAFFWVPLGAVLGMVAGIVRALIRR